MPDHLWGAGIETTHIPAAVTRTCLFSPDPSSPHSLACALEGSGNETRLDPNIVVHLLHVVIRLLLCI